MKPRQPKAGRPRAEGGSRWAETRVAFTIARRNSVRSLGRSVLIALLVALPIAGLTGLAVTYASGEPTAEERVATELAGNAALLQTVNAANHGVLQDPSHPEWWLPDPTHGEGQRVNLKDVLPENARVLPLYISQLTTTADSGAVTFRLTEGPTWDPVFSGMYDIVDGRAPRNNTEVAATRALLDRLGLQLGDSLPLQAPKQVSVTIAGVMEDHTQPDSSEWFYARSGALSGKTPATAVDREHDDFDFYVSGIELDWADVRQLNGYGVTALSRAVLLDPPVGQDIALPDGSGAGMAAAVAIGAGFAAFEVILLAGAAFAVTARQHQRSLATIASVGAPRRTLFLILATHGVVLGALGGVLGVLTGIAGAWTFMQLTADGSATQYYGLHLPWLALACSALFAALIGWVASLFPARNASRFDIVAALRGARKPPMPRRRTPVIGMVTLIVGVALTLIGGALNAYLLSISSGLPQPHPFLWLTISMFVAGPILAQIGLMICGPLILRALASVASRSSLASRLATRDAARNPNRAVPALAAIMTTVFSAVFVMCLFAAADEYQRRNHLHALALGHASVDLNISTWEEDLHIRAHENPQALENALRATLKVDELRVISAVAEPLDIGPSGGQVFDERRTEGQPWAAPRVPAKNLCPDHPASPEYTPAHTKPGTPEELATRDDWRCQFGPWSASGPTHIHLVVGDVDDLSLVLDREPSEDARWTLENGGAVSLYPHYVADGKLTLDWMAHHRVASGPGESPAPPVRSVTIPAVLELPDYSISSFPVFISPETADQLDIEHVASRLLASTDEMPTAQDVDKLFAAVYATLGGQAGDIWVIEVERGPNEIAAPWLWGLLGLCATIAIASSAVAIGLARFDGRQDDATLAAVGATPQLRRGIAFWQAIVVAGVGALLGAATGLVPALALDANPQFPFMPPWSMIGLTVIALPMLIAAGSWLFTRRPKVQTRRMSIA